jgi:hypothetical protein
VGLLSPPSRSRPGRAAFCIPGARIAHLPRQSLVAALLILSRKQTLSFRTCPAKPEKLGGWAAPDDDAHFFRRRGGHRQKANAPSAPGKMFRGEEANTQTQGRKTMYGSKNRNTMIALMLIELYDHDVK